MARRMARRLGLLLLAAALPLVLWSALPLGSDAQSSGEIQRKIDRKRAEIDQRRGRERVLTTDISAISRRIGALQSDITLLQTKQVRLETDLAAKREALARIQEELRRTRLRLAQLRARLAEAKVALAGRLVELYKADKPDVVTVVLKADGFADLLERTEFMQRVSSQDARIVDRVRKAKAEATATAKRLDRLEARAEEVAAGDRGRGRAGRPGQDAARRPARLLRVCAVGEGRRCWPTPARRGRSSRTTCTRSSASRRRCWPSCAGRAAAVASPGRSARARGPSSGPPTVRSSSPFGTRWGRLHAGIDIPLPVGTPMRAAAGGRVVIAGWVGGYGNYTCIQHSGGLSTCYGHQSSIGVSVGQSVSQGQVIGASGNTGNSTGPHVHFEVRVNGSPVDPLGYL